MSTSNSNATLTPAELTTAGVIGGGLLVVSIAQGGSYLQSFGETPVQKFYLVAMVFFVILGSQMLIRLAILNWNNKSFYIAAFCIVFTLMAERMSFLTTEAAVHGRAASSIRNQNQGSDEYKRAVKQVTNLEKQLEIQLSALERIPPEQTTNTRKANADVKATQQSIARAQKGADGVNVSTIAATMKDGGKNLSKLIAFLQSAIPITLNVACMFVSASRRKAATISVSTKKPSRVQSGKKPSGNRARLKAV